VVEAAPAPVAEEAVVEAVIAEAPRSVQDAVEQHQEAEEKEHEPKPLV
jgi:ribonuclease E